MTKFHHFVADRVWQKEAEFVEFEPITPRGEIFGSPHWIKSCQAVTGNRLDFFRVCTVLVEKGQVR